MVGHENWKVSPNFAMAQADFDRELHKLHPK
jgi:hypothetical protein